MTTGSIFLQQSEKRVGAWNGYATQAGAKTDLFDYIEPLYSCERRHSTLGYKSPTQHE